MKYATLSLLVLILAACAGTQDPPDEMVPPPPVRQGELTRLFDRMGSDNEAVGVPASKKLADGDDRDRRFVVSLWGTRKKSAVGAQRYGDALSAKGLHEEAFEWYERGFMHIEAGDPLGPWLRYQMASEYYALGRKDDCINLLANRMGTEPLPKELKGKYDELIEKASRS
ncbi:MAG: hypothetical protein H6839_13800 [Planctomycetes bacterium]|nr:hypothetical protein [Planctomycetota bacterium]